MERFPPENSRKDFLQKFLTFSPPSSNRLSITFSYSFSSSPKNSPQLFKEAMVHLLFTKDGRPPPDVTLVYFC